MHGAAFEAYTAMQQFQAAGVDAAKVQHITSAVEETGVSAQLQEAAGLAGMTLPASLQVCRFAQPCACIPMSALATKCRFGQPCLCVTMDASTTHQGKRKFNAPRLHESPLQVKAA